MAKIRHGGKTYDDMSMHEFYIYKNVKEMIAKLMNNPELLAEFNRQMRSYKLNKIKKAKASKL